MGLARPEKGRDSVRDLNRQPGQPADGRIEMAKSGAREYVWLQCIESGDLNYWAQVNFPVASVSSPAYLGRCRLGGLIFPRSAEARIARFPF
jgi:hypothetical protein